MKRTGFALYRGLDKPRKEETTVPKSKVRKKKTSKPNGQWQFSPRDPILGEILVGRGWRYLGSADVTDVWDFPAFSAVDAHALIACKPDGYRVDLGTEDINLITKHFTSRHELAQELRMIESWGERIREGQEATARDRAAEAGAPHT